MTNPIPLSRIQLILGIRDMVDTAMIEGIEQVTVDTYDLLALISPDLARLRDVPTDGDTTEFDMTGLECDADTRPYRGVK